MGRGEGSPAPSFSAAPLNSYTVYAGPLRSLGGTSVRLSSSVRPVVLVLTRARVRVRIRAIHFTALQSGWGGGDASSQGEKWRSLNLVQIAPAICFPLANEHHTSTARVYNNTKVTNLQHCAGHSTGAWMTSFSQAMDACRQNPNCSGVWAAQGSFPIYKKTIRAPFKQCLTGIIYSKSTCCCVYTPEDDIRQSKCGLERGRGASSHMSSDVATAYRRAMKQELAPKDGASDHHALCVAIMERHHAGHDFFKNDAQRDFILPRRTLTLGKERMTTQLQAEDVCWSQRRQKDVSLECRDGPHGNQPGNRATASTNHQAVTHTLTTGPRCSTRVRN